VPRDFDLGSLSEENCRILLRQRLCILIMTGEDQGWATGNLEQVSCGLESFERR
jgi:hypothetical protein